MPGGWDLAALVRAKRYRFILNLIDHLPVNSHYAHAVSQDEQAAEQMNTDAPPRPPSLTEYGPDVRVLAGIYDRLGALIAVSRAAAGDKHAKVPPPWPRPVMAADLIKKRRAREKHNYLKSKLLSGR